MLLENREIPPCMDFLLFAFLTVWQAVANWNEYVHQRCSGVRRTGELLVIKATVCQMPVTVQALCSAHSH